MSESMMERAEKRWKKYEGKLAVANDKASGCLAQCLGLLGDVEKYTTKIDLEISGINELRSLTNAAKAGTAKVANIVGFGGGAVEAASQVVDDTFSGETLELDAVMAVGSNDR